MFLKIGNYNNKSVKTFWAVPNDEPMTTENILNKNNKAATTITLDFSTLCAKFPHKKLLKVIYDLINFRFDGDNNT